MRNFPLYFDTISAQRPSQRVIGEITAGYENYWANPYSPHHLGQEVFSVYAKALKDLYSLCGFEENGDLIFTGSGAEAVNQVFAGAFQKVSMQTGCDQFIVSAINEAPSLMCAHYYKNLDLKQTQIPAAKEGAVSAVALEDAFSARSALVSVSWVNALTGVINPIEEIAALCEERAVLLHVDVTHALGKLHLPFKELPLHYITASAEPLGGPSGIGFFYAAPGAPAAPFIQGGIEQGGLRASSPAIPLIKGLAAAVKELFEQQGLMATEIAYLRSLFEEELKKHVEGTTVFFEDQLRVPHCSAVGFRGVANEALCYHLSQKGIYPSIGGGNLSQIAYHLEACGIPAEKANTALSFSFPCSISEADIAYVVQEIMQSVEHLRKAEL